ncbi:MAG: hypothetical protein AAF202_07950, partial [Pseudomonadota bacterium]
FGTSERVQAASLAIAELDGHQDIQGEFQITDIVFHSCGNNAVMFWLGDKLRAAVIVDSKLNIISTRVIENKKVEVASESI